jgi:hypothetical protein
MKSNKDIATSPVELLREMGYRFSEKSGGWFKVSQEFLRLEAEALAAFHQKYEEYKLNRWLYFEANPGRSGEDGWGGKDLKEALKDRPLCPSIWFDLDPADYQEGES